MVRVGVVGAAGKMGATVCRAVHEHDGLELVAAIDPAHANRPLSSLPGLSELAGDDGSPGGNEGLLVGADLDALVDEGVEVVIDFTVASAARQTLRFASEHRIHVVCGTTGFGADDLADAAAWFAPGSGVNAVICPNFAVSAVVLMRLCELAAPFFDSAEIVELHHDQKRDAPSGTAMETARRISESRAASDKGAFEADRTDRLVLDGARGGAGPANIRLHSVRLRGLVAHQEVLFGALGQSLTIRQDSYDRTSFMPGVLLATERVASLPGLTLGLDRLLGW